jgi:hypothetical protein
MRINFHKSLIGLCFLIVIPIGYHNNKKERNSSQFLLFTPGKALRLRLLPKFGLPLAPASGALILVKLHPTGFK